MINQINREEALKLIAENKKNSQFVIIDVRTTKEFEQQHLPQAVNFNIYDQHFREQILKLNRQKIYLIYCKSGGRSSLAAEIMEELGFLHLYNLNDMTFQE